MHWIYSYQPAIHKYFVHSMYIINISVGVYHSEDMLGVLWMVKKEKKKNPEDPTNYGPQCNVLQCIAMYVHSNVTCSWCTKQYQFYWCHHHHFWTGVEKDPIMSLMVMNRNLCHKTNFAVYLLAPSILGKLLWKHSAFPHPRHRRQYFHCCDFLGSDVFRPLF